MVHWQKPINVANKLSLPNGECSYVLSSNKQDIRKAKYELQHFVQTNKAQDDESHACVFQDVDFENKVGVSISKGIVNVAGDALKGNIAALPLVFHLSNEQIRYGFSIICHKIK